MQTIQAMVNPRLLSRANQLFTGTAEGRIIEVLQNARRAGATKVEITNRDGYVTVRDNGRGIEDFAKLLGFGGSGWEDALESSEDPAGMGLFCLAPREVTIRSNGKMVVISGGGWTGAPIEVQDDPDPVQGTVLRFEDETWIAVGVQSLARFSGMEVTVDGYYFPPAPFISNQASSHPALGCRIEVCEPQDPAAWRQSRSQDDYPSHNVLVNFHGQVVASYCHLVSEHNLHYLVDMTGEPTGIRMMLPARTRLVENEAFEDLKNALELEAFRYLRRRGDHRLPYREYARAKKLGVNLPEAKPTCSAGLLSGGDSPDPVGVVMPKDPLSRDVTGSI